MQLIGATHYGFGNAQTKFAASSVLPEPCHWASIGYGHSGRVRWTFRSPGATRSPVPAPFPAPPTD